MSAHFQHVIEDGRGRIPGLCYVHRLVVYCDDCHFCSGFLYTICVVMVKLELLPVLEGAARYTES